MTATLVALVAAVSGAVGAVVAAVVAARRASSADRSADWQAFTDDLMAQVTSLRSRVDAQDEKITTLQIARQHDQGVILAWQAYIGEIERGILAGTVPPVPPRPTILGGP